MESLISELTAIQAKNVPESREEEFVADTVDEKENDDIKTRLDEHDKKVETDNAIKLPGSGDLCTLDEDALIKDNFNPDCSWRNDSQLDEFDEDEDDSETDSELEDSEDYDTTDEESEEAAAEWLRQYYLRQKGVPPVLAQLPASIKVSLVQETSEEKEAREERNKLRKEEALRKIAAQPAKAKAGPGKRKFGDRMELEEASRDDFDNGQDYVDFLNGKLKNVSIKVTK